MDPKTCAREKEFPHCCATFYMQQHLWLAIEMLFTGCLQNKGTSFSSSMHNDNFTDLIGVRDITLLVETGMMFIGPIVMSDKGGLVCVILTI